MNVVTTCRLHSLRVRKNRKMQPRNKMLFCTIFHTTKWLTTDAHTQRTFCIGIWRIKRICKRVFFFLRSLSHIFLDAIENALPIHPVKFVSYSEFVTFRFFPYQIQFVLPDLSFLLIIYNMSHQQHQAQSRNSIAKHTQNVRVKTGLMMEMRYSLVLRVTEILTELKLKLVNEARRFCRGVNISYFSLSFSLLVLLGRKDV